jgi:GNAT superfamily N-acetyltransferase
MIRTWELKLQAISLGHSDRFRAVPRIVKTVTAGIGRLLFWYRYHATLAIFRSIAPWTLADTNLSSEDFAAWARATARRRTYFSRRPLTVRELTDDDIDRCVAFALRVSPHDVRRRFGRAIDITDRTLCKQYLMGDKNAGKLALAAFKHDHDDVLGIGILAPCTKKNGAEVALLVRSDLQQKGIGSVLLCNLIWRARIAGYDEISGTSPKSKIVWKLPPTSSDSE